MKQESFDIKMTAGGSFEGYEITEYLDFVSGQIALASGFLANIAEMTTQESNTFTSKLQSASDTALEMLMKNALALKADGIIGVALTYSDFSGSSIGAVASGTAVKLKKIQKKEAITNELFVSNYYTRLLPRPVRIRLLAIDGKVKIAGDFYNYNLEEIKAIRADVELENFYGEKMLLSGIDFTFEKNNISMLESFYVECDLDEKYVGMTCDAKVYLQKYVTSKDVFACTDNPINVSMSLQSLKALKKNRGIDAFERYHSDGSTWTCNCGHINGAGAEECAICQRKESDLASNRSFNYDEMLEKMKAMTNVTGMKDVLMQYIKQIDPSIRMELLEIMESGLQYERTRGDMTSSVYDKVLRVFETN